MDEKTCRYRIDESTDAVYEWDNHQYAYIFVGLFKSLGKNEVKRIKQYITFFEQAALTNIKLKQRKNKLKIVQDEIDKLKKSIESVSIPQDIFDRAVDKIEKLDRSVVRYKCLVKESETKLKFYKE